MTDETVGMDTSELSAAISKAIRDAYRFNEYADLGGYDADNAFDTLTDVFKRALAEAQAERKHVHQWNTDLRCACGADGAA